MGNYLETLKNITKEKKKEKLIYILVLCVVLFIATSYIFNDTKGTEKNVVQNTTKINDTNQQTNTSTNNNTNTTEDKLAKILSQISGIGDVSVMITYSSDVQINPVYNVKEEEKDGQKTVDKSVVYNEENSNKTVVIESTGMPTVEGVIVVATGASNLELKSQITQAVSAVTSVATYKIQVFEKKE